MARAKDDIKITASFITFMFALSAIESLNIQPPQYTVITVDSDLLTESEPTKEKEMAEINRRGYAGDEFYQKASKSVPRIGRRSTVNPIECNCAPYENIPDDPLEVSNNFAQLESNEILKSKLKRFHSFYKETSAWPWFKDRVLNTIKHEDIEDNCYYISGRQNYISKDEICNEDSVCCPIELDSSILKRYLQTPPKQTTTITPDYKGNRFI